jgi:hypothetical protein
LLKGDLASNGLPFTQRFTFKSNSLTTIAHKSIRKHCGVSASDVFIGCRKNLNQLEAPPHLEPNRLMKTQPHHYLVLPLLAMFTCTSLGAEEKSVGVGAKPIPGAEVIVDGSRQMLDALWTYWEGPRFASSLPIKWKIVEDPVDKGTVVSSDDPAAAGGSSHDVFQLPEGLHHFGQVLHRTTKVIEQATQVCHHAESTPQ